MDTRRLGAQGPELSVLGLGCNNFGMKLDAEQTKAVVETAMEVGITHFDTAEMYGGGKSEEFLGAALGTRRDEVVLATKYLPRSEEPFRPGDLSRRITDAADGSLRRLGTDRIDVFYQHYPDPEAPLDELLDAFESLITSGKVLHAAISNVDAAQITATTAAAQARDGFPLRGVQVEWNLLARGVEDTIVPAAHAAGLGVVPYFPLASGLLTGKYSGRNDFPEGSRLATLPWFAQAATPENLAKVDSLSAVARRHERTIIELAFGWLLAQPDVTSVIAGATTPEQVNANVTSIGWSLTASELAEIDQALAS
ncbi:aldo/keto reductase [Saccharopolyspora sp. K220]|uniref:aldo/keto reductase n=1 Tax=Saccharopolyspora soli TaxID=2926618 RepID=UPI001F569B6C|nr:aldo/keto reductase [Saccharopolyspora soli]MCI2417814.1 aldo/keto reductase [Saccharopolyspora soli]